MPKCAKHKSAWTIHYCKPFHLLARTWSEGSVPAELKLAWFIFSLKVRFIWCCFSQGLLFETFWLKLVRKYPQIMAAKWSLCLASCLCLQGQRSIRKVCGTICGDHVETCLCSGAKGMKFDAWHTSYDAQTIREWWMNNPKEDTQWDACVYTLQNALQNAVTILVHLCWL